DVGVHHPLGELPDHRAQHVRARRGQGLLELRAGNRHNVTCGHFALLRCSETTSKDREVAASHHGDTPHSGNSVTSVPVTPYTTSVDVNERPLAGTLWTQHHPLCHGPSQNSPTSSAEASVSPDLLRENKAQESWSSRRFEPCNIPDQVWLGRVGGVARSKSPGAQPIGDLRTEASGALRRWIDVPDPPPHIG